MARAKAPFTLTRYLQVSEATESEEGEQHEIAQEDAFDEEGNLLEGVHRENVNVKPGDEVELTDEQTAGLHGYLEGYETEEEAQAREEREARESGTGEQSQPEGSSAARQPGESGASQQSDSSASGPAPKASSARSKKT
jgi:hypothetical protein